MTTPSPYKQQSDVSSECEESEQDTSTTQPFRFLALPPELRNKIYTHLFQCTKPLVKPTYTLPGLLLANHQIHAEALGLYYSTSTFRCLDEASTINWLCCLSKEKLGLLREVRYDTRWIIYKTPFIPVPGAECWLWVELGRKLKEKGIALEGENSAVGNGVMQVSFYAGEEGQVRWTDKMGLIETVRNGNGGSFW